MFHYLRNVSYNSKFSIFILQTLIEEHRFSHRDRWNEKGVAYKLHKGDVVKTNIQIQSKLDNGEVGKLSHRERGPFQIVEDLGSDSYHAKRYHNTDSAVRKCKGTDLYFLPLSIFLSESLDTMDVRYLNYSNGPIIYSLKKHSKQRYTMIRTMTNSLRHNLH